jgi:hypothetical protein
MLVEFVRREWVWSGLRSTPSAASPLLQWIGLFSLTALYIVLSAPRVLFLSTKTTMAPLPLRLSSPGHIDGSALSSSSTTPSATSASSFLFRFLPRFSPSGFPGLSVFHRLCMGCAGIDASNSTRSTIEPPSWSTNSARKFPSVASIGTFARKRLFSSCAVGMLGACGFT